MSLLVKQHLKNSLHYFTNLNSATQSMIPLYCKAGWQTGLSRFMILPRSGSTFERLDQQPSSSGIGTTGLPERWSWITAWNCEPLRSRSANAKQNGSLKRFLCYKRYKNWLVLWSWKPCSPSWATKLACHLSRAALESSDMVAFKTLLTEGIFQMLMGCSTTSVVSLLTMG